MRRRSAGVASFRECCELCYVFWDVCWKETWSGELCIGLVRLGLDETVLMVFVTFYYVLDLKASDCLHTVLVGCAVQD